MTNEKEEEKTCNLLALTYAYPVADNDASAVHVSSVL
jgi:hypothetical protein